METDRKIRILVIEDDVEFRNLLRIHLSMAGYELELAEDGVEGGKALLAQPPDLVLCDLDMPFMGGLELLSLVGKDELTASIPVIVLSCHSDSDTAAKVKKLGAADFLTKPVTLNDLMKSIHACLVRGGRKKAANGSSIEGLML